MSKHDLHRSPAVFGAWMATSFCTLIKFLVVCCMMINIAEAEYKGSYFFKDCLNPYSNRASDVDCVSWIVTPGMSGFGDCFVDLVGDPPGGKKYPCDDPNPCQNNGVCSIYLTDSARCTCNDIPFTGEFCENLYCGDFPNCYRDSDLVLYVDMRTPMSWNDANDLCTRKRMQLFMDKNWTLHGFAYGILNQLVTDRDKKVAFWMGMSRDFTGAPWTFVDGTDLASLPHGYTNWGVDPGASDGKYVELANTEDFKFQWVNVVCDALPCSDGFNAYPICEKRFPKAKW